MNDTVIVRREGPVGQLSLNRPQALHALTQAMCEAMTQALLAWRDDPAVELVVIDHASGRGFCAGGDVALVRQSALDDRGTRGRAFFMAEYRLNHLLFSYPKPLVVVMDGVTMGGGAGLAMPCDFRIATENTLFAMPEGAIGLFPDVGMGWHLPRLPGRLGAFLALTGARLDGAECLWAGIATHYLASSQLGDLVVRLSGGAGAVEDTLSALACVPPPARLSGNADRIDRLFAAARLEEILAALADDPSDWAAKEWRAVHSRCPTSAKVALRLLSEGSAEVDFEAEMAREYRLAARMIMRADFAEGVRAVLIDKDQAPRWSPAEPADVDGDMIDTLFAPLPAAQAWSAHPRTSEPGRMAP